MKIFFKYSLSVSVIFLLIIQSVSLTACSKDCNTQKIVLADAEKPKIVCTDLRPMICTNEYLPVCATKEDGTEKTYATGCSACADKLVVAYRKNACQEK